jgi:hypothetical protein
MPPLIGQVWYKLDATFKMPKVNIKAAIVTPLAYADPLFCNLSRLYVDVLKVSGFRPTARVYE